MGSSHAAAVPIGHIRHLEESDDDASLTSTGRSSSTVEGPESLVEVVSVPPSPPIERRATETSVGPSQTRDRGGLVAPSATPAVVNTAHVVNRAAMTTLNWADPSQTSDASGLMGREVVPNQEPTGYVSGFFRAFGGVVRHFFVNGGQDDDSESSSSNGSSGDRDPPLGDFGRGARVISRGGSLNSDVSTLTAESGVRSSSSREPNTPSGDSDSIKEIEDAIDLNWR